MARAKSRRVGTPRGHDGSPRISACLTWRAMNARRLRCQLGDMRETEPARSSAGTNPRGERATADTPRRRASGTSCTTARAESVRPTSIVDAAHGAQGFQGEQAYKPQSNPAREASDRWRSLTGHARRSGGERWRSRCSRLLAPPSPFVACSFGAIHDGRRAKSRCRVATIYGVLNACAPLREPRLEICFRLRRQLRLPHLKRDTAQVGVHLLRASDRFVCRYVSHVVLFTGHRGNDDERQNDERKRKPNKIR